MAEYFYDPVTFNIWSPISFDLKPGDYYVGGAVNMETTKHPHNTEDSPKDAIEGIMADMNKEYLIEASNRFRNCVDAVNETDLVYNFIHSFCSCIGEQVYKIMEKIFCFLC